MRCRNDLNWLYLDISRDKIKVFSHESLHPQMSKSDRYNTTFKLLIMHLRKKHTFVIRPKQIKLPHPQTPSEQNCILLGHLQLA